MVVLAFSLKGRNNRYTFWMRQIGVVLAFSLKGRNNDSIRNCIHDLLY